MSFRYLLLAVLLLAFAAQAQSAADAAHASQDKSAQNPSKKVYTNDDISTSSSGSQSDASFDIDKAPKPQNAQQKEELGKKITADVLTQEKQLKTLQAHLDRLNKIQAERAKAEDTTVPSVDVCTNEPERCEGKREFLNDLARTNTRLTAAKQKLEETQEKARKMGYPSAIWDPAE